MWWLCFMSQWNGRSFIPIDPPLQDVLITTDASGNWGCAAIWGNQWWQWRWTSSTFNWNIAAKELFPIVLAAATWGSQWWHAQVNCHCDNLQAAANVCTRPFISSPTSNYGASFSMLPISNFSLLLNTSLAILTLQQMMHYLETN